MAIKQEAIDAVARAMAQACHEGGEELPQRDIELYHQPAKLFLAAHQALAGLKSSDLKPADVNAKAAEVVDEKPDAKSRRGSR